MSENGNDPKFWAEWFERLLLKLIGLLDGDFRINMVMDACNILFFGAIITVLVWITPKVKYLDEFLIFAVLILVFICVYMVYDCYSNLMDKIRSRP